MKNFDKQILKCLYDNFLHGDKISVISLKLRGIKIDNRTYHYDDIWNNMQDFVKTGIFNKEKIEDSWYYVLSISKEKLYDIIESI